MEVNFYFHSSAALPSSKNIGSYWIQCLTLLPERPVVTKIWTETLLQFIHYQNEANVPSSWNLTIHIFVLINEKETQGAWTCLRYASQPDVHETPSVSVFHAYVLLRYFTGSVGCKQNYLRFLSSYEPNIETRAKFLRGILIKLLEPVFQNKMN
jgi:hypothetical protein